VLLNLGVLLVFGGLFTLRASLAHDPRLRTFTLPG
jgi:hypothetical protein